MLLRFRFHIDAKYHAHQPHGQQNTANPKRIRHRVAHPHLVHQLHWRTQIAQDLLSGPQRRSIGDRTGENPQHHRQRNSKHFMQDSGNQSADDDDQNRKQIETQTRNPQRGEEPWPHLNPNGVDEQNQAKFLDKVQHIAAQRHPSLINEVADDNAAEQHAADAKADTPHLDVADPQSDNRHQRQNADRQCYITHFLFPVNNISIYMDYD